MVVGRHLQVVVVIVDDADDVADLIGLWVLWECALLVPSQD